MLAVKLKGVTHCWLALAYFMFAPDYTAYAGEERSYLLSCPSLKLNVSLQQVI